MAGATWTIGRQMVTRDDLSQLRTEIQVMHTATREDLAQLRADTAAARRAADEQMRELRGFIVQHLDGHAQPDD